MHGLFSVSVVIFDAAVIFPVVVAKVEYDNAFRTVVYTDVKTFGTVIEPNGTVVEPKSICTPNTVKLPSPKVIEPSDTAGLFIVADDNTDESVEPDT